MDLNCMRSTDTAGVTVLDENRRARFRVGWRPLQMHAALDVANGVRVCGGARRGPRVPR